MRRVFLNGFKGGLNFRFSKLIFPLYQAAIVNAGLL
ncbi:MAG: hypothetical protein ACJAZC_002366 [Cryomorphaceae bacterium]|jgi:hypothetical protein